MGSEAGYVKDGGRVIQNIITIPDPRLLEVCEPILAHDDVSVLARDLWDTARSLKAHDGKDATCVGLAAPQIGVLKRLFIINTDGWELTLANPEFIKLRGGWKVDFEKCFSEPGVRVEVLRFQQCEIKHLGGRVKLNGYAARVAQHEMDHLNGKLISRFTNQRPKEPQ